MTSTPWTPIPEFREGIPDVFIGEPSVNREEYVNGFFAGVGRVLQLADQAGFFEKRDLVAVDRELPLTHVLETIYSEAAQVPQPRPQHLQELNDKASRLLEILDTDRGRIGGYLPREGSLFIRSNGFTEYAY